MNASSSLLFIFKKRVSILNSSARDGGRQLQNLTGNQRSDIIENLSELLLQRQPQILKANAEDLKILNEMNTTKHGGVGPLRGRLTLTPAKLKSLSDGLKQIADSSSNIVGRVMRRTLLSTGLELTQVTVPIGVLLVIFESRPDVLPQVSFFNPISNVRIVANQITTLAFDYYTCGGVCV